MPLYTRSVEIRAPLRAVFAFHMNPANLTRVAPPESRTEIIESSEPLLRVGARVAVRSLQMGLPVVMEAEIVALEEDWMFEDRQVSGPFRRWRHRHEFAAVPGGTRLTDEVEYELPGGVAGRMLGHTLVARQLERLFAFRQEATRRLLEQESEAKR